jgi:hypothetical protein
MKRLNGVAGRASDLIARGVSRLAHGVSSQIAQFAFVIAWFIGPLAAGFGVW